MQRVVKKIIQRKKVIEGAGVKLNRVLGNDKTSILDPFLLLDHFGSDNPIDYIKGFPWHPHRGMETVTYMWTGEVEHGDSIGNSGVIKSGDVQWMTAGSGILHQEMPRKYNGLMQGFQLWVNLPANKKMTTPTYRGIQKQDIPLVKQNGIKIKVLSGKINNISGPVQDLSVDVEYFDVEITSGKVFTHATSKNRTVFAYVIEGTIDVYDKTIPQGHCSVFSEGNQVTISSKQGARILFITGEPLTEPVAWRGPIVMNTQEELNIAFQELNNGTFIKTTKS